MAEEKILIVDDDLANAVLCQRLLERAGFKPQVATNANDALHTLRATAYDLLITDIRMPDLDGFELMAQAAQSTPDLAILVITGFGTVENAVKALRLGADGLILKPIARSGELVETVKSVLQKRQNKLDALRLKFLRPLFDVGEHFYSETTPDCLAALVTEDICNQTNSAISGILVHEKDSTGWHILAGKNLPPLELSVQQSALIENTMDSANEHAAVLETSVEDIPDAALKTWLRSHALGGVVYAPVGRKNRNYIFFAIRENSKPLWGGPDKELFAILARQAAVALENADLYNELKEFIQQLEDSQRSLIMAEKMAALGRLMASLAHELNNPLQGVQNCLHLAEMTDLPENQRQEFIQMARREVERVSKMAQTAMEYHRPSHVDINPENIKHLLDSVLTLLDAQLRENQIEVVRSSSGADLDVPMIRDKVQQVVLNLVLNAQDALSTVDHPKKIWIDVADHENGIEICIEDNGPGLDPAIEQRLFEPFVSTKAYGSGLGLAISYELIVDVHGGELGFVPPVHAQGARVRIVLPRRE